jgi:hypothetical protein
MKMCKRYNHMCEHTDFHSPEAVSVELSANQLEGAPIVASLSKPKTERRACLKLSSLFMAVSATVPATAQTDSAANSLTVSVDIVLTMARALPEAGIVLLLGVRDRHSMCGA